MSGATARCGARTGEGTCPPLTLRGSRTDDGFLLEFALAAKEAGIKYLIASELTPGRAIESFQEILRNLEETHLKRTNEDLQALLQDAVGLAALDVDDEADAAGVVLVGRIIESSGLHIVLMNYSRSEAKQHLLICVMRGTHGRVMSKRDETHASHVRRATCDVPRATCETCHVPRARCTLT